MRPSKHTMYDSPVTGVLFAIAAAAVGCRSDGAGSGLLGAMEAKVQLHNMARSARAYFEEEHRPPVLATGSAFAIVQEFPPSTELTPARCCEGPCAPRDAGWNAPGWLALRFAPEKPHRFRYSFTST